MQINSRQSWRKWVLAAWLPGVLLCAQPADAQVAPLTPTQRANVRLALDNLRALIKNGRAMLPAKPKSKEDAARIAEAARQLRQLQEIHDNLNKKLAGSHIHGVDGLKAGNPKKYRQDSNPPGTPRAAYCDGDTWILDGKDWKRCREGDVVVDGGIIDPGGGTQIDESTQPGWQLKWGLIHVLAHEKMHEILINEQIEILKRRPWWKSKTEAERRKLIDAAKAAGSTPERHQQVYEWQKNVLRWEREMQEAVARKLHAAPKPDAGAIKAVEAKVEWLTAEIARLERDMVNATNEHEFAFAACGWPQEVSNGLVNISIFTSGMYWQIQTVVKEGKPGPVSVARTVWLGRFEDEKPIMDKPALSLLMPEAVFTGLHVQPESCAFMKEAVADGRLSILRARAPGEGHPAMKPPAAAK